MGLKRRIGLVAAAVMLASTLAMAPAQAANLDRIVNKCDKKGTLAAEKRCCENRADSQQQEKRCKNRVDNGDNA